MHYRFHEGSIEIPDDWNDESMNIFKAPIESGYNLVISRERVPKAIDPKAHRVAQRKIIAESLIGFSLRERRPITLDGDETEWMEYGWNSPQGPMSQVNILRIVDQSLVSFTFTSARPFTDADRQLFDHIVRTYKAPPAPEKAS
ncbi:MAG TPA: DcrB-related protein [Nannocystaceae bacterium]|nr:DcrB-related protein [Nannocystaceae bacterium]